MKKAVLIGIITICVVGGGLIGNDGSIDVLEAFWWLFMYVFGLTWLGWTINGRVFSMIISYIPINKYKLRTFLPYYLIAGLVAFFTYIPGFVLLFSLPIPEYEEVSFSLSLTVLILTSFIFATFYLYDFFLRQEINQDSIAINAAGMSLGEKRISFKKGDSTYQLSLDQVSYVFLQNSIVYFVEKSGNRYPVLSSLAEISGQVNSADLFRANRQFLVTRNAIKSWRRTKTRKILLELSPSFNDVCTISKNRASDFSHWISNES